MLRTLEVSEIDYGDVEENGRLRYDVGGDDVETDCGHLLGRMPPTSDATLRKK